ncbi:MAG: beta-hexosaminidase [Oscillospiraceae bacterium]|nr:beta-hexosaminidase [Oscillospiraceae bacterium]
MRILSLLLCLFLLTGCASPHAAVTEPVPESTPAPTQTQPPETTVATTAPTEAPDPIGDRIALMSLEERVGQLFLARCSAPTAIQDIQQYHLGGFVLFGVDIRDETPDSLRAKLSGYQDAAGLPLLIAVDEEGGTVTRVSRYPAFRESNFASPRDLYSWGGMEWVLAVEEEKCSLLGGLGINVNLGPVCDISTDPAAFLYERSLGLDAYGTADFVAQTVGIMNSHQIGSSLKHFPGYGNNADTHTGIAVDMRSLEELEGMDLIPFLAGIQAGCGSIMVSHTIVSCMDPELPASLSPAVHAYIRNEMGFEGVIITDDLVMQAITDQYGAGEAAVLAVLAGNDLLCSSEYAVQYEAVLAAVLEGRIDIDTLNRAVRNVLEWKAELGLL